MTELTVHHLHLHHGDRVRSSVTASNGAQNSVTAFSPGFILDLTPPIMHELSDGPVPGKNIHFSVRIYPTCMLEYIEPQKGLKTRLL